VTEAAEAPKASPNQIGPPTCTSARPTRAAGGRETCRDAESPRTPKACDPKPETPKPEGPKPKPEPTTDKDAVAAGARGKLWVHLMRRPRRRPPVGPALSAGEKEIACAWRFLRVGTSVSLSSEGHCAHCVVKRSHESRMARPTDQFDQADQQFRAGSQGPPIQASKAARRAIIAVVRCGYQLPVENSPFNWSY